MPILDVTRDPGFPTGLFEERALQCYRGEVFSCLYLLVSICMMFEAVNLPQDTQEV
jgi:hypothetical protein